uniref:Uncharacterized protein n=1 Tax=Anguilla anguilla TaxID=7936 RepID=A0A0E9W845_ANGAN
MYSTYLSFTCLGSVFACQTLRNHKHSCVSKSGRRSYIEP